MGRLSKRQILARSRVKELKRHMLVEEDSGASGVDHMKQTGFAETKLPSKANDNGDVYSCITCGKGFPDMLLLEKHERIHSVQKCTTCGEAFSNIKELTTHMRNSHTEEKKTHTMPPQKSYQCNMCGETFPNLSLFKTHKQMHYEEKPYKCTACGEAFSSLRILKAHQAGKQPYNCLKCGKTFCNSSLLNIHILSLHTKVYNCTVCAQSFPTKSLLKMHKQIHREEKVLQCATCGETFFSVQVFKTHQTLHAGKLNLFNCSICGKADLTSTSLKAHQRIHSEGENATGASLMKLKVRKRIRSKKKKSVGPTLQHGVDYQTVGNGTASAAAPAPAVPEFETMWSRQEAEWEEEEPYGMADYDYDYAYATAVFDESHSPPPALPGQHIKQENTAELKQEVKEEGHSEPTVVEHGEEPSVVECCDATYSDWAIPVKIIKKEEPNNLHMDHTDKNTNNTASFKDELVSSLDIEGEEHFYEDRIEITLDEHQGPSVGVSAPHQSATFGKAFKQRDRLDVHLRSHSGEAAYQCGVCGKAFKTKRSVNRHQRVHSGDKPHGCDVCGKRYTWRSGLVDHQKIHTEERHYCHTCGKGFPRAREVKSHMAVHQRTRPKRSYECDTCGMSFERKKDIQRHQKVHRKAYKCWTCGEGFQEQDSLIGHRWRCHPEEMKLLREAPAPEGGIVNQQSHAAEETCSTPDIASAEHREETSDIKRERESCVIESTVDVKQREETHDRSLRCPTCEEVFVEAHSFLLHLLAHTTEKSCASLKHHHDSYHHDSHHHDDHQVTNLHSVAGDETSNEEHQRNHQHAPCDEEDFSHQPAVSVEQRSREETCSTPDIESVEQREETFAIKSETFDIRSETSDFKSEGESCITESTLGVAQQEETCDIKCETSDFKCERESCVNESSLGVDNGLKAHHQSDHNIMTWDGKDFPSPTIVDIDQRSSLGGEETIVDIKSEQESGITQHGNADETPMDEHQGASVSVSPPHQSVTSEKSFKQRDRLDVHLRSHSGEAAYHQCYVCGKVFKRKHNLKDHQQIHTGKTQRCPTCGKCFSRVRDVKKHHMAVHQKIKPKRLLKCATCGKVFTLLYYFKLHQRTHTREKSDQCALKHHHDNHHHDNYHHDNHLLIKHHSLAGDEPSHVEEHQRNHQRAPCDEEDFPHQTVDQRSYPGEETYSTPDIKSVEQREETCDIKRETCDIKSERESCVTESSLGVDNRLKDHHQSDHNIMTWDGKDFPSPTIVDIDQRSHLGGEETSVDIKSEQESCITQHGNADETPMELKQEVKEEGEGYPSVLEHGEGEPSVLEHGEGQPSVLQHGEGQGEPSVVEHADGGSSVLQRGDATKLSYWATPVKIITLQDLDVGQMNPTEMELLSSAITKFVTIPDAVKDPLKKHSCSVCGDSFKARRSLELHQSIHTGERPYHCRQEYFTHPLLIPTGESINDSRPDLVSQFQLKRLSVRLVDCLSTLGQEGTTDKKKKDEDKTAAEISVTLEEEEEEEEDELCTSEDPEEDGRRSTSLDTMGQGSRGSFETDERVTITGKKRDGLRIY
ncbi:zinc finger protein 850-like [Engraulis encrasicolus]|uniref:zinc finger protein 850-like n=1 Tax=Engraulis encrasicolus TaxID=184585 RepID=UPI002FD1001A